MLSIWKQCIIGRSRPGAGGFDPNAQAFITAVGTLTGGQQTIINTFVVGLKADGLYTKGIVGYPIVGGTAAAHKWNLFNPLDTDGAFRDSFTGGITHSATGMLGDGSTGFGNTHLVSSSFSALDDFSFGTYIRNNVASSVNIDIGGADTGVGTDYSLNPRSASDRYLISGGGGQENINGSVNSQGFIMLNRTVGGGTELWRNGALVGTGGTPVAPAALTQPFYVMAENQDGIAIQFSARQTAFVWIGSSLTAGQCANLYTRIQTYQTSLARQV